MSDHSRTLEEIKGYHHNGFRSPRPSAKPVLVNVIMRKTQWIVRVNTPNSGLSVFITEPSVSQLNAQLEDCYPGAYFRIDYAGFFQIF